MTLYLLEVHLQTFPSVPITQKWQILNCDTLVTNERYIFLLTYTSCSVELFTVIQLTFKILVLAAFFCSFSLALTLETKQKTKNEL
jgi:hypothetical protein